MKGQAEQRKRSLGPEEKKKRRLIWSGTEKVKKVFPKPSCPLVADGYRPYF
jgi:hypothetical protein